MSLKRELDSNRDEPESGIGFQREMSLKRECRMLRMNDHSHEQPGTTDAGRDGRICDEPSAPELLRHGAEIRDGLIEGVLRAQKCRHLSKEQKGVVKEFLAKVTALSRAQITRLIGRWTQTKRNERQPGRQPSFPRRYTAADVAALDEVDAVHEDLS